MEINLSKAVRQFFPNPSLEMIYFEAVANSIDAGATKIDIDINITSYKDPESLNVNISDNGKGFTDTNFLRFSKLLETAVEGHKGLGRLVYLNYFRRVEVSSQYDKIKREFVFDNSFHGDSIVEKQDSDEDSETKLKFRGYIKKTIKTYDYIRASSIKKALELHFFPKFHSLKMNESELNIEITVTTDESNPELKFYSEKQILNIKELPKLKELIFQSDEIDLLEKFKVFYDIRQTYKDTSVITAIIAEGRTIPLDIVGKENIPDGYEIVFLIYSKLFDGLVNNSRQRLDVDDTTFRIIKNVLIDKIGTILNENISTIGERNQKAVNSLNERYPHLQGYFNDKTVGLIDRNKSLEVAQRRFFQAQKEILEAVELTQDQYEKSLEVSSRLLTEYILYRNIILGKLKKIDLNSSEGEIHNFVVPKRKILRKSDLTKDIYTNNAWLLDDKYMSYATILSDMEMEKLIKEISSENDSDDGNNSRPDISIVFSNDPKSNIVDVVIVELKKLGLNLAKREEVVSQLKQRARKLINYYPNTIQRIWFYGIVDINQEFRISLKEMGYTPLYSNDTVMYNEEKIIIDEEKDIRVPVGVYIMSFEAFLKDAESRNSTFLNILKAGFRSQE